MRPILLATTSRYKKALFERLGLTFEQAAPPYEETHDGSQSPIALAEMQAQGKAESLATSYPSHTIIGGDQVLDLEGEVFTKPGSTDAAVAQLLKLAGKMHALHTAFCIHVPEEERTITRTVSAFLSFHADLSESWLHQMVTQDGSQDCVGGYKYESMGLFLMKKVETDDVNAIVGLPLMALIEELALLGYFPGRFQG